MAVPADAPYISTKVSLYLHEMHAFTQAHAQSVCPVMAVHQVLSARQELAGAHSTRFPSPWGTRHTVPSGEHRA